MPADVTKVGPISRQDARETVAMQGSFAPSKPRLEYRLIDLRNVSGKQADKVMGLSLDRIEREKAELIAALQEQFKLELNRSWADTAWWYVDAVSKGCMSLLTFFAGGALVVQGQGQAGGALLAAGFIEATQQLFTHLGIWDEVAEALAEKDQNKIDKLKTVMPLILSFMQVACMIAGAQGLNTYKGLFQGTQTALGLGAGAGKAGVSIYKADVDAQYAEQKAEHETHTQAISLESRFVTALAESRRQNQTITKKTILKLIENGILAAEN